jgi:spermidine synthase
MSLMRPKQHRLRHASQEAMIDVSEKNGLRSLHLAGSETVQSTMRLSDPVELVLNYTRCMLAAWLFRDDIRRVLIIGLGGGSLAKYLYHRLPDTHITAVEINPAIVAMARSMFFLPPDDERLQVIIGDGAAHLASELTPYDLIIMDAYDGVGVAEALVSEAFFDRCQKALTPNGILAVNLWGSDRRFPVYHDRIARTFNQRTLQLPAQMRSNVVVFAFNAWQHNPSWQQLRERARALQQHHTIEFLDFVSQLASRNPHSEQRLTI